ncbi:transmembrane protein 185-like [Anaeramoeba flamelloides]|uniref:Transmembrane protein 185-like n=1 Tax=Anaeramoeba flamelloides TaxID=1746091 RepID=A0AAV7YZV7_9EUKA|nr:transmembrane protein 185-like [Anaeramoeba flamelloides]
MDQPPNHLNISFRGLVGLNEEEIEHELNNNFYVLDKNVTVVIIEPDVIHDLKTGTFLEPPPLTKIHHETEDLFLNDLPQDLLLKIFEYTPLQKLGLLSLTCKKFQKSMENTRFWSKVAENNENLLNWNSLRIISQSDGKTYIVGNLNDSIILQTENPLNNINGKDAVILNYGKITKFIKSKSIKLIELSEKFRITKKHFFCKPQSNTRIRKEFALSLIDPKYELIERYQYLNNAYKFKKIQDELSQERAQERKIKSYWKTLNKLQSFAINCFWIAIFLFGIFLNIKINGNIKYKRPLLFTLSPLIIVVGLVYFMTLLSLVIHHNKIAIVRSICLIIGLSILISPFALIIFKLENIIKMSWRITFLPIWIIYGLLLFISFVVSLFGICFSLFNRILKIALWVMFFLLSLPFLFFNFLTLKLDKTIDWNWGKVFIPIYILVLFMILALLALIILSCYLKRSNKKNSDITLLLLFSLVCLIIWIFIGTSLCLFTLWLQTNLIKSFTYVMIPFYILSPFYIIIFCTGCCVLSMPPNKCRLMR